MAKTTKKQENKIVTRAEKKDAAKNVIKELLAISPQKHNELIEETARIYTARYGGEDTENINDVKGRIGSVLDIMKKEGEIMYDGGRYALKSRLPENQVENSPEIPPEINPEINLGKATETPVKKPRGRAKKAARTEEVKTPEIADAGTEKPKKTAKKADKAEKTEKSEKEGTDKPEKEVKPEKTAKTAKTAKAKSGKKGKEEEAQPLPPAPLQPIAPVAPVTPEIAPEPLPEQEKTEDKPAKKTVRSRVKKSVAKEETKPEIPTETEEKTPPLNVEERAEEGTEEKSETAEKTGLQPLPIVKEKAEVAKKTEVMDMSFLFGATPVQKAEKSPEKPVQKAEKSPEKPVQKTEERAENKAESKAEESVEEKPAVKQEKLALKVVKTEEKRAKKVVQTLRKTEAKPQTADERLKEAFLRKLRSLGGDYFEYYSVYLLERYSMKNGRRLEGMKISGGDRDGGIDGEIELTDKFGFRETIYIQSKNWNPDKGDERLWVVGETLLQQFIGACACRQAQDKKQHCRGIFVTTSRFTPDAKRILETMSDKIVGYDGEDLYEAAKECSFGLKYENGNWKLDEKLLSGTKAFFTML